MGGLLHAGADVRVDPSGDGGWTADVQRRAAALTASKHRVCIAVFAAAAEDPAEEEDLRSRIGADTPIAADPAWTFAGFDVADGTQISGLSNCGYDAELQVLRATWAPRLNDRGLFRRIEDACAFRKVTDARGPEHAPSSVYGIWIVPR